MEHHLTYKIGLLTADEIAFSGYAAGALNLSTYLQENTGENFWWSLSPGYFNGNYTSVWFAGSGNLHIDGIEVNVSSNFGLRPAISLVSNITISGGSGTSEDPYVIN